MNDVQDQKTGKSLDYFRKRIESTVLEKEKASNSVGGLPWNFRLLRLHTVKDQ